MAKFNTNTAGSTQKPDTTNRAGGEAFSRDSRQEIATVILSSMINGNSFYEKESDRINRIIKMVANSDDAEFLAKAMVYVRNEGNLRTVSHIMGAILSENVKGSTFLRSALAKTMLRPDDMTEMVALYNSRNGKKMLPNVLRRSMKDVLESKWDEYQLKKYLGESNSVKLRDIVKLTHPEPQMLVANGKATDTDVFKRVIEGTLSAIETAQTTNSGYTGEARAENYYKMLSENKLGYMAALKNLKNILEAMATSSTDKRDMMVDKLVSLFGNAKLCHNSMVLPFRFVQAHDMIKTMNMDKIVLKKLIRGIEDGFILSAKNLSIVEEGERVALLLDESGSMGGGWGSRGREDGQTPFSLGKTIMASMLTGLDHDKTVGYLWADNAREISIEGRPFDFIERTRTQGGGTDVKSAFTGLIKSKTVVDKIVILTDNQGWRSTAREVAQFAETYRKISPKVKILFWDLEGLGGGTPMKLSGNVLEVAGFSDKMLSVIPKMWQDKEALIKEILAVQL